MSKLELSDREFGGLRDIIAKTAGIYLDEDKQEYLARRVQRRLDALELTSVGTYAASLTHGAVGARELESLINTIVVLETYFFRQPEHFEMLSQETHHLRSHPGREELVFRAWSAACASGEEAYSLAMALKRSFGTSPWRVRVQGTDISEPFIDQAQVAIYGARSFRDTSAAMNRSNSCYFHDMGPAKQVSKEIVDLVRFSVLNLVTDPFPHDLDAIFCRNVLIYFREDTAKMVISKLRQSLRIGGVLFLGAVDSLGELAECFEPIEFSGAIGFRRRR